MLAGLIDLFKPSGVVDLHSFAGTLNTTITCLKTSRSCISLEMDERWFRAALYWLRNYLPSSSFVPTFQATDDKHRQKGGTTSAFPCIEAVVWFPKDAPSTPHFVYKDKISATQSLHISQLSQENKCAVYNSVAASLAAGPYLTSSNSSGP